METAHASVASDFVKCKLDEFFWEWLCLPESQKIVRQAIQFAKNENSCVESPAPSPHFSAIRGSSSGRPSPPGSPHSRGCLRDSLSVSSDSSGPPGADWSASVTTPSPPQRNAGVAAATGYESSGASRPTAARLETEATKEPAEPEARGVGTSMLALGSKVIPRFWWPKRQMPTEVLTQETRQKIHDQFIKQGLTDIRTSSQLEPIVTEVFGLSKYFVVPIFHKIKVFYDIVDDSAESKSALLAPSPVAITEQMLVGWCEGRIQPDDPVLSFFLGCEEGAQLLDRARGFQHLPHGDPLDTSGS